jgi:hypothetical protein
VSPTVGYWPEQLTISNSGTTLRGNGAGVTVIEPTTVSANTFNYDTATSVGSYSSLAPLAADILVANTTGVTVEDLTVNGQVGETALTTCSPGYVGVDFQSSSGTLTRATVENIVLASTASTCQEGLGVLAYNGYDYTGVTASLAVTISHTTVSNTQANEITCDDPGLSCTIESNTVTGVGPEPSAFQNGIQVYGAYGTVTRNTVSDNSYTGSTNNWYTGFQSAGIALFEPTSGTNVSHNVVTDNQIGIADTDDGYYAGTESVTIADNTVDSSSAYGIVAYTVGAAGDSVAISGNTMNNEESLNSATWGAPGILVDGGSFNVSGNHILGSSTAAGSSNGASQVDGSGTVATAAIEGTSESSTYPTTLYTSNNVYRMDSFSLATLGVGGGTVNVEAAS